MVYPFHGIELFQRADMELKNNSARSQTIVFDKLTIPYLLIGVLVGFGPWRPLTIFLFLPLALYLLQRRIPLFFKSNILLQIAIVLLFLINYYILYGPTAMVDASLSTLHFAIFIFYAIISMLLVSFGRSYQETAWFLMAMSVGMLLHAAVVVVATIIILPPPYYGQVFIPFTGDMGNSPAYSNLALFFPVVLLALVPMARKGILIVTVFGLLVFTSLFIGVLLGGRTYFVALVIVLLVFLLTKLGNIKYILALIFLVAVTFTIDLQLYEFSVTYRESRDVLIAHFQDKWVHSSRWEMYGVWFDQVVQNPINYPIVPLNLRTEWFHNFWLDVYRDSGLVGFFFALSMFIIPLAVVVKSIIRGRRVSLQFVLFLLPVFAVFFTSIPMVGERAVMLFYFALSIFILKYGSSGFSVGTRV